MLDNKYNAQAVEQELLDSWAKEGTYAFNPDTIKKIFSIDTPPPTMSGNMHLGHAFSFAQQDFIARYKRMQGYEVFYPFGTDDNGLASEKLVQKKKKVNGARMDRQEFIQLCTEYLDEARPEFIADWQRIGMSCDFDLQYSTINNHCRAISQKSFLDLVKKGRAYRKEAPVIWDTQFQTAIAQAELESIEKKTYFNDLQFKTTDGETITIATTRPELLGGCVAVFAHPDDKRYQHLFGKHAVTPVYNVEVPILPDDQVSIDKGTGLVMCCTFGDTTDIEWYKKHNLPLKMVVTPWGKMNDKAGAIAGLSIVDARKKMIEILDEQGYLVSQKEIIHNVNVGERSGRPVEIINSKQWYIKYLDLKKQFLLSGEKLQWFPPHMRSRLNNWIEGLNWDWSISRQRHFGVPIPVWYDAEGNVYFADESQLPVDPIKDRPLSAPEGIELFPEKDVFDTWFTSSSTPFLARELVKGTPAYNKLFPMNLRPQAHDIINFWLFYTMAKTQIIHEVNPWSHVTISGFVLDPKGNKMSKSKGNVIAPQEVIEKYSADAIRYWAATSKLGDDLPYQEKDVKTGMKFANKLWNAARFIEQQLEGYTPQEKDLTEAWDKWVITKLQKTIKQCTESFEKFEYSQAKRSIDSFFFHTFCDNYLEVVKDRLYNPDKRGEDAKCSAQYTLYTCLKIVSQLYAPLCPFVTEKVYRELYGDTVHTTQWPQANEQLIQDTQVADKLVEHIAAVRKHKSDNQVSLGSSVETVTIPSLNIEGFKEDFKAVTRSENVVIGETFNVK